MQTSVWLLDVNPLQPPFRPVPPPRAGGFTFKYTHPPVKTEKLNIVLDVDGEVDHAAQLIFVAVHLARVILRLEGKIYELGTHGNIHADITLSSTGPQP